MRPDSCVTASSLFHPDSETENARDHLSRLQVRVRDRRFRGTSLQRSLFFDPEMKTKARRFVHRSGRSRMTPCPWSQRLGLFCEDYQTKDMHVSPACGAPSFVYDRTRQASGVFTCCRDAEPSPKMRPISTPMPKLRKYRHRPWKRGSVG